MSLSPPPQLQTSMTPKSQAQQSGSDQPLSSKSQSKQFTQQLLEMSTSPQVKEDVIDSRIIQTDITSQANYQGQQGSPQQRQRDYASSDLNYQVGGFGQNSPSQRKTNKIFERLYAQGRKVTPTPAEQPEAEQDSAAKLARVNTIKNRKLRMNHINHTYSQTLQRNMFALQRQETEKVQRKALRQEKIRIIKSASRRNPQLLAQAIVKSKQALVKHAEWRINQEIMRSTVGSQRNNSNDSPSRFHANVSSMTIDMGQSRKTPSGVSTKVMSSASHFFEAAPKPGNAQDRSATVASLHSGYREPSQLQAHKTISGEETKAKKSKRSSVNRTKSQQNTSLRSKSKNHGSLHHKTRSVSREMPNQPQVEVEEQVSPDSPKKPGFDIVGEQVMQSYFMDAQQQHLQSQKLMTNVEPGALMGLPQLQSARFAAAEDVLKQNKRLAKSLVSHGSIKPLHQSAFLLKKMRQQMKKRRRESGVQQSADFHKQYIESYASHLRQSSSRSLSQRSKRTRASAEFGQVLLSRKDSGDMNRYESKTGIQFAQEVQEAIVENNRAMSPGPRSTSIEEPPSFREPENQRFEVGEPGSRARPMTGASRTNRNKLFTLNKQQKNSRLLHQVIEQRQGSMMRFQSCQNQVFSGEPSQLVSNQEQQKLDQKGNPYFELTQMNNRSRPSNSRGHKARTAMRSANSARGLIKARMHPYQRPISTFKRTDFTSTKRLGSIDQLGREFVMPGLPSSMQRINYLKGYAQTTAAWEGSNGAKVRSALSSAQTTQATLKKKKAEDSRLASAVKLVYGAEENWIEKSPRSMRINKSILSQQRLQETPLVDSPGAIEEDERSNTQSLLKNQDLNPISYEFESSGAPSSQGNVQIKLNAVSRGAARELEKKKEKLFQIVSKRLYNQDIERPVLGARKIPSTRQPELPVQLQLQQTQPAPVVRHHKLEMHIQDHKFATKNQMLASQHSSVRMDSNLMSEQSDAERLHTATRTPSKQKTKRFCN